MTVRTCVPPLTIPEPTATFYIWADISALPHPLNDCLVFLEECAKHKIICVVSFLSIQKTASLFEST